jgi:hypothetical protein
VSALKMDPVDVGSKQLLAVEGDVGEGKEQE